MSDILIKDMEMPKRGMVVNIYADGRVTNHFDEFGKTIGKAVPVPPHGRLIDADALLSENVDTFTEQTILKIKFAPTILDAEEAE